MGTPSKLNVEGRWVLVTGASSGLGAAIARELAVRQRANLILVARRQALLDELREELERIGSDTTCIAADLADEASTEAILRKVLALDPVAAVLNAGVSYAGRFIGMPQDQRRAIVSLNVASTTDLLSRLAEHFVGTGERRGILVVSSLGGETTLPTQAVYAASKAYLTSLTRAISLELSSTDTTIGAFLPGGIDTEMAYQSGMKQSRVTRAALLSPQRCARAAVEALLNGRIFTVPGLLNKATALAAKLLPRSVTSHLAALPYER